MHQNIFDSFTSRHELLEVLYLCLSTLLTLVAIESSHELY